MLRSTERFVTTHVGSLARPQRQLELLFAKERGESLDTEEFDSSTTRAVDEIVAKQVDCGIDIVCDGEQSKASFLTYIAERLGGFSPREHAGEDLWVDSRETLAFPEFYEAPNQSSSSARRPSVISDIPCCGAISPMSKRQPSDTGRQRCS